MSGVEERQEAMPTYRTAPPGPGAAPKRRLSTLAVLVGIAFAALLGRLFQLQVLRHGRVAPLERGMLTSYSPLRGHRGDIRLQDGTLVAREVEEFIAAVDPKLIAALNLPGVIDLLCRGLGLSDEERRAAHARIQEKQALSAAGSGPEPRFIPLRRGISRGLAEELRGAAGRLLPPAELRGVIFSPIHFRRYPRGSFLGAVVGATRQGPGGDDLEGVAGLELALDGSLTGRDGQRKLRCEGRRIDRWFWPGEVDIPPVHGYNAVLTIDSRIQGIAEEELERGLEREKGAAALAIVMDCRTGAVLAMANLPSLDPNHYHDYPQSEFEERRRNRAVESQYEPGSTIKPFIAALALDRKLLSADQRVWDGGRVHDFGQRRVEDVSDHGPISLAEAVIFSSNIGMAHVGLRLGREGLIEVLDRFGFQRRTGLGLPGEAPGTRTARSRWSETYTSISVSFGYEVTVTPIQLCTAFASLVNGGRFLEPRIVERLERDGEVVEFPVREVGRPIREETSRGMREILVGVVERGTARALRIPGLAFGGKSGTAVVAGPGGYAARNYLSSFIAFAPHPDPELVVLAMIERPRVRHYGSTVAGPVVAEILRRTVFSPLGPPEGTVKFSPLGPPEGTVKFSPLGPPEGTAAAHPKGEAGGRAAPRPRAAAGRAGAPGGGRRLAAR